MRALVVVGIAFAVASCSPPPAAKPIDLRIEADGSFDLGSHHLKDEEALKAAVRTALAQSPGAEFNVTADRNVHYDHVAKVMADFQAMGVMKIGIVGTDSYPN